MYDPIRQRTYVPSYDIWLGDDELWNMINTDTRRLLMAARNPSTDIKKIHNALGGFALNTHDAAERLTAAVSATLHFGSPSLNIQGDPKWGRRRNPSGILSDDVLSYGETNTEHYDYIKNAGASNWELVWAGSTPGPWAVPDARHVVGAQPDNGNGGDSGEVEPELTAILQAVDELEPLFHLNLQLIGETRDVGQSLRSDVQANTQALNNIKDELIRAKEEVKIALQAIKAELEKGIRIRVR